MGQVNPTISIGEYYYGSILFVLYLKHVCLLQSMPMKFISLESEEEASLQRYFKYHIMNGIVPTVEECERFILKTPNERDRNYLDLREDYVRRAKEMIKNRR